MALTKSRKKELFNMAYGLGASIVILGALFKILHWEIGFLTGGLLLAVGLVTEAAIFALSAFEPVEEDPDWTRVYPELAGGSPNPKNPTEKDAEGMLSKKLDDILKEARIDFQLMGSLGEGIRNFGDAAKNMVSTSEAVAATKKYGEELAQAAAQVEALNQLYKVQIDLAGRQTTSGEASFNAATSYGTQLSQTTTQLETLNNLYKVQTALADKQASINEEIALHSARLKEQMQQLATHLESLNTVYGGMLSAMNNRN